MRRLTYPGALYFRALSLTLKRPICDVFLITMPILQFLALETKAVAGNHCFRAALHSTTLNWNALPSYVTLEYLYAPLMPLSLEIWEQDDLISAPTPPSFISSSKHEHSQILTVLNNAVLRR
jgi:hypothetical protein